MKSFKDDFYFEWLIIFKNFKDDNGDLKYLLKMILPGHGYEENL